MSGPDPAAVRRVVEEWIQIARDDLRGMRACCDLDPPLTTVGAYLCQQAAEKVLKGFHVQANIRFRKTHDLGALADVVALYFPAIGPLAAQTEAWTDWNSVYRYPNESDVPDDPTVEELVAAAELIERLIEALLDLVPPDDREA